MKDIVLQVVVVAAFAAGCSKKATSAASGTTGSAAAKVATSPAAAAGSAAPGAAPASACDELGKVVEQHVPAGHANHTKAIVECMVDLCNSDKWSHDVIACIDKAPFDAKACQPNLTPDQYEHLSTAIAAEFGSDGAPGGF